MKRTLGVAVILGGLSLAGCGGGYAYYASTPPPPVRVDVRGAAPGAGFVWIDGYWGYIWSAWGIAGALLLAIWAASARMLRRQQALLAALQSAEKP